MLGILEERGIQRGIIVYPGNMTPSARKACPAPQVYPAKSEHLPDHG